MSTNLHNTEPPTIGVPWRLEGGVEVAKLIEHRVKNLGYHTALGGSVLMYNLSFKDLDIYLYPRTPLKNEVGPSSIEHVIKVLSDVFIPSGDEDAPSVDGRYVYRTKYLHRNKPGVACRVDIFFLEKYGFPLIPELKTGDKMSV